MESTSAAPEPADAKLLDMVWAGDTDAFGVLYDRHVGAARRLADLLIGSPPEADDVVEKAFADVLEAARQGTGVSGAVRPYVLTMLRQMCDEQFPKSELADLQNTMIARAYFSLPDSWWAVLWHTEVEQGADADVAPILGVLSGEVASLRRRAVGSLRQAYLDGGGAHEEGDLDDVGATLRAVVGPLVLGSAAAEYLADAGHDAAPEPSAAAAGAWQAAPVAARTVAEGSHAEFTDWDDIYDPDPDTAQLSAARAGGAASTGHPLDAPVPGGTRAAGVLETRRRRRLASSGTIAAAAGLLAGAIVLVLAATFIQPHRTPSKASSLGRAPSPRVGAAQTPTPLPSAHSPTPSPSRSPLLGLSTSRSPSPSTPPSPAPPSPASPAPATAQLSASIDPGQTFDPFEPSDLTFQVDDVGSAATGPLTASVTIPGDVEVVPDGPTTDGWNCEPTGSNGATCTGSALSPGQSSTGTIEYTDTCGQFSVVVTSGSMSASAEQDEGC
jgi:DNA-directed RNA polymerase specialized sigma24 family protein